MEELEQYKNKMKKNIEKLINSNELEEAEKVILEYEEIKKNDVDIISMKAIMLIMKSELYEAEKLLIKSLNKYGETFDLLFNLAYLYEMKDNYQKAYYYYVKADKKCNNNEIRENIQNTLSDLKYNYNADVYMEKKQVLVVAQIFPPMGGSGVQRTLKFVKYLRKFNWEPVVVTVGDTAFNYLKDSTLEGEIPKNLQIVKFDEKLNLNANEVTNLIENYTKLIQNEDIMLQYKSIINKLSEENNYEDILKTLLIPDHSSFWAMEVINKIYEFVDFNSIDIIYSTSGPYSDHIIAYFLKEKYNKPWVCDFRDEWTNNPYANFDKNYLGYKMIAQMEKNILEKSNKIITTTPLARKNYIDILNVPKEKIITITNGYDEEDFQNIQLSKEKNNKFTIIHNGMLYMIRTPDTFLMAIKKLIDESRINKNKIEIIFSYTENKDKWINYLKENNMDSIVTFKDYMSHEDSVNLSINSDMLLLIVGPGEKNKGVYTGKIFEYLRMNKPILSLSPKQSVVEELLNENQCGENFEFNDIIGMSDYIYKKYKEWEDGIENKSNNNQIIKKYERKGLTQKLASVFEELLLSECYNINKEISLLYSSKKYKDIFEWINKNYTNSEMYLEVIEVCRFWINKIDNSTGSIYFIMGYIYNNLKEFDKAIKYHKMSLKLDSKLADIKYSEHHYKENYDETYTHCIGCNCKEYEIINVINQSLVETNLGLINPLRVWVKCKKCGLIYTNLIPSEESMDEFYFQVWKERRKGGKYTNVDNSIEFLISMSNKRLEKLENIYKKKGSILDIGTGIGVFTGVAKERGWQVEGLEFNKNDCEYAKKNFGITLLQENFYDFSNDRKYDVVTMFEVIEHLRTPLKDLKKIGEIVKKDGMFVIATPIVDSLHAKKEGLNAANWYVVAHLSYFSFDVLKNYLHLAGFKIVEINYSPEGYGRLEFYCSKLY
ncbi:methyltransferase domain-containing protein [Clostridium sporogenes]